MIRKATQPATVSTYRTSVASLSLCLLLCAGVPGAFVAAQDNGRVFKFIDRTSTSGINFRHFSGQTGKHFIVETVTAGLVTFDYNNDGLIDIYLLNGAGLQGNDIFPKPTNRLYRNLGGFRFADVTAQSNSGDTGFALGAVAADVDNDGDQDLFISNFGSYILLENDASGRFSSRVTAPQEKPRIGAGVVALDLENDGDLDLYAANYVDFDFGKDVNRTIFGVPAAPGPKDYEPDSDLLWENDGAGQWNDISTASGITAEDGPGMGVIALDFTDDGLSDIFVCNDSAPNFFLENMGNAKFMENALLAGLAYGVSGAQQASMGADVADWNHDGYIDIATTNFIDETPTLYENSGQGYFDDIGPAVGLGVADRSVTWGIGFADFDNDTWPDLFIASGHLISGVSKLNDSETFEAPNHVLRNEQGRRFRNATDPNGPVAKKQVSRGVALDDFNNDGQIDAVILNLNDQIQILENVTGADHGSQQIRLIGTTSARDPAGAVVTVEMTDGSTQTCAIVRGRGYQSSFGHALHFGTGNQSVKKLTIQWPSGKKQTVDNPSESAHTIVER